MLDREEVVSIYGQSITALVISLGGGLFAGTVLGMEGMRAGFEAYPGLLLLLPAFLATRGNVYGALGARISSGLHQGLIPPRFEANERLVNAVVASFVNGIGISLVIALLSYATLWLRALLTGTAMPEEASLAALTAIMLVAGVLTAVVMIAGLLAIVFSGFSFGYDPDNLVGPIVTTLGDVFGVVFLYVAILVVGVVL